MKFESHIQYSIRSDMVILLQQNSIQAQARPTPKPQASILQSVVRNVSAQRVTIVKGMEALVTLPKSFSQ